MSFNNALKKVLGLGDYGEGVDDLEYFEKRVYDDPWHKDDDEKKPRTNKDATAQGNEDNADGQQAAQQAKPAYTRVELPRQEVDMTGLANTKGEGVPENILKRFINIINGNLSPHILNHLNVEAETQSIVESLRPQFRDYESNLRKEVLASAADRWNKERAEIIEKLKETDDKALQAYDEIEELKEKIKATENSRKSTLTRYNDLQKKMQDLMTAKEKTDMENRSLQNKMKVLQNNEQSGDSNDKTKEELLKLNDELTKERKEAIKSKERIAQLQKQVDDLKAGTGTVTTSQVVDDKVLKEKDEEIDNLAAQVAWLHRKLDQANEELDRANEELAQAEQLVDEINKFEEIKQRKDDEIASLKKKLQEESNGNNDNAKALAGENKKLQEKVEQLTRQLANAKNSASAESSTILDDLDDGIEFTGKGNDDDQEEDKNQMSLF